METTQEYFEKAFIDTVIQERAERENPFVIMLPNRIGGYGWYLENRYPTQEKLDDAVKLFAEEFKEDNDGYAPKMGVDFMAMELKPYIFQDAEDTMTDEDWREVCAEQAREERALA